MKIIDTYDLPWGAVAAALECSRECVGVVGDITSTQSEMVQYVLRNWDVSS